MEGNTCFRAGQKEKYVICAFPYAALKAFIPVHFIPSETHFSTGYK